MPDPSAVTETHRPFPGMRVVAGGFLILTTGAGLGFYGLAVYLNALSKEKGWDVGALSLGTTVFFVVSGFTGLAVARMIAQSDARRAVLVGAVIGAVALLLLGRVTAIWQLYLVYALYGVGFSAAGLVTVTTVVTRWYHRRRAMAISVASTGLSFGGVALTPAMKWFVDEQGMAGATPWLALIFLFGCALPGWFLLRSDPAELGFLPDGERAVVGSAPPLLSGTPYREALKSRFFFTVSLGYVLSLGSQVGGIQQLVKLAEERTTASTAAFATLALAVTSIVARLLGGKVFPNYPLARVITVLSFFQMIALVGMGLSQSAVLLFAFIILFGATVGNILMMQPLLIAERFGVREYPRLFSRTQFVSLIGVAGGPWLLGWLHDVAGGYETAYVVAGVMSLAGVFVFIIGGPAENTSDHTDGSLEAQPV
ncbi:MAG: MFS transporter [Ilumatobacteraceae bacterium]